MRLRDHSVLVVEDEILIGYGIMAAVEDAGGVAVGPVESVKRALQVLGSESITAAVLDVNVRDGEVTPVAMWLVEHAIPFVVQTGGAIPSRLRPHFGDAPILSKPVRNEALIDALTETITRHDAARDTDPDRTAAVGHVLLIEDEAETAAILEGYMRSFGFVSVDQADTEDGAVFAAKHRRPDLMVVDLRLREGHGLAAAAAIRAAYGTPLIVVTADPGAALGVDKPLIVAKPFSKAGLQAAIAHARSVPNTMRTLHP